MWDTIIKTKTVVCLFLCPPIQSNRPWQLSWMSLYKGFLAYSISSTSTSNCMATTARSENRSSDIVRDLDHVLIHFISENDHSPSVLVISRVQAMSRRRWMFGKASSSQATSGSSLSVDCPIFSIYLPHFQGIWKMECLSPRTACLLPHHPAAVPYLL